MRGKIIKGSLELGAKIKQRRNELGYTIEEAATKAGVGTKTWSRYEAGESIRRDKIIRICKVLNWNKLPDQEENEPEFNIIKYRSNKAWSQALADNLGEAAAISFVIGSEILLDNIQQDLDALSCKPKGTHIGELEISWLKDSLPPQFLMQYDYDFLHYFKSILLHYRSQASSNKYFVAHTVMEEIVLYIIMKESEFLMESIIPHLQSDEDDDTFYDWNNWPFDLFDDMDVVTFLYTDSYLAQNHPYHFQHWQEDQFYCTPCVK